MQVEEYFANFIFFGQKWGEMFSYFYSAARFEILSSFHVYKIPIWDDVKILIFDYVQRPTVAIVMTKVRHTFSPHQSI